MRKRERIDNMFATEILILLFISSCRMHKSITALRYGQHHHFKKCGSALEDEILPCNYSHSTHPLLRKGEIVHVYNKLYVKLISDVQESTMVFRFDFWHVLSWKDTRIKWPKERQTYEPFHLPTDFAEKIWFPDVLVIPLKELKQVQSHRKLEAVLLYKDSTITNAKYFTSIVNCAMDFTTFPLDIQRCYVVFKSARITNNTIDLRWENPPLSVLRNPSNVALSLSEYTVEYFVGINSEEFLPEGNDIKVVGLNVTFIFKRIVTGHLLQSYLPSSLLVVISWFTFCIPTDATAQRVIITMTTIIALSTQLSGIQSRLPQGSYPCAIVIWYVTCLFLVISILVELSVVSALGWKYTILRRREETLKQNTHPTKESKGKQKY